MIIDFHAHIFPEKIAEKASANISKFYDLGVKYNGSIDLLLQNGKEIGVTKYIVHSTATKPEQVESINNFIISEIKNHPEFVGFGTIHQSYENYAAELERIKEAGLKGIKLHPDFQKIEADSDLLDPIYNKIAELKLPVLFHAGDTRFDFSGPKRLLNVHKKHPDLIMICAHLGGWSEWNESEKYLVGQDVYFDSSSSLDFLSPEKAEEIIRNHGIDKVLFGTDYPMWNHKEELERFNKLNFTQEEKEKILYLNAKKLLNL